MDAAVDEFIPYFIAYVIQSVIFGITLSQTIVYFLKNKDGWKLHVFISTLLVLNSLSMAFIGHSLYYYLVGQRGILDSNSILVWSNGANVETINITVVLVQLFFARQVYFLIRKNKYVAFVAAILALSSLAFGTAAVIHDLTAKKFSLISTTRTRALLVSASTLSAASDIVSVGTMCLELIRSRNTLLRTRSVVSILLYSTLNRGILVLIWQIVWCTWAAIAPASFKWGPIFLSLPGLYTNTCLGMLNFREFLRSKIEGTRFLEVSVVPKFARPQQQTFESTDGPTSTLPVTTSLQVPGSSCTGLKIPKSDIQLSSTSTIPIIEMEGSKHI